MTITSVTIIGPIAIPHRDSSADHAGGWLVGCVSSLGFPSFYRTNFLLNVFIDGGARLTGRVEACLLGWPSRVFVGASNIQQKMPFHSYFLINKLHIRTARLLRSQVDARLDD